MLQRKLTLGQSN